MSKERKFTCENTTFGTCLVCDNDLQNRWKVGRKSNFDGKKYLMAECFLGCGIHLLRSENFSTRPVEGGILLVEYEVILSSTLRIFVSKNRFVCNKYEESITQALHTNTFSFADFCISALLRYLK